jgi:signal transduction histidine kinase
VRAASIRVGPAWQAGAVVQPILERAVRMNLSSARVLDPQGCIVASSAAAIGECLDDLEEVQSALAGQYAAVLRHRYGDDPPATMDSISRRGRVRVFTAMPVFADGAVIGVVRMSRTALDPAKALWFDRYRLLATLAGCAAITAVLSLFLSRTLERPLRAITQLARGIARGEGRVPLALPPLALPRLAPQELRDLSAALGQMIGQLSDRAEYIRDFAANVSHELKTPITAIRGAAELLSHQWSQMDDATRARFLANIDQDAERMQRLVTGLLQLARIQSAPESSEEVELEPFLAHLAQSYGPPLHLCMARLPRTLRIHPDHLESALRNLIDNALRHGEGAPVDLEADSQEGRVHFRVRDRGPGISEGNRDRVLQRFFTTERDRGGTGLGLNIAKAVAETRGGALSFTTSAQGSCFTLVL